MRYYSITHFKKNFESIKVILCVQDVVSEGHSDNDDDDDYKGDDYNFTYNGNNKDDNDDWNVDDGNDECNNGDKDDGVLIILMMTKTIAVTIFVKALMVITKVMTKVIVIVLPALSYFPF